MSFCSKVAITLNCVWSSSGRLTVNRFMPCKYTHIYIRVKPCFSTIANPVYRVKIAPGRSLGSTDSLCELRGITMGKPINIASITRSVSGRNNVQVTVIDDSHIERVFNLSPPAQDGLLKALLAAEPFGSPEQDAKAHKNFLLARSLRLFEGPNKTTGIEVLLGPGIAIHILLPAGLPEALENLLHQFPKDSTSRPH